MLCSSHCFSLLGDNFFPLHGVNPAICFPPDGCLNNGHCVSPGICSCARGWSGAKCENGTTECYSIIAVHVCTSIDKIGFDQL